MEDSFPRFQYSVFDKNGHDAQWVVRGNDWEQFLADKEAVISQLNTAPRPTQTPAPAPVQPPSKVLCQICKRNYHDPKWGKCYQCSKNA